MNESKKKMSFLCKNDYNASVIVTSDTCSKDPSKDTSGRYVAEQIKLFLKFKTVNKYIVEDDEEAIKECVKSILKDNMNVLIVTVGGTGLCPRDVTPEATSALYDRHCKGIETYLYMTGLRFSPQASLSRLTAGVASNCLIINFPGKLKACQEYFPKIEIILEHAFEQINFDSDAIKQTHERQNMESKLSNSSVPKEEISNETCSSQKMLNESINRSYRDSDHGDCIAAICKNSSLIEARNEELLLETKNNVDVHHDVLSNLKTMRIESPYKMIDYQEALDLMRPLSRFISQSDEEVVFDKQKDLFNEVVGRHLADDVYSKCTIPQYPCSTVDGYVLNLSSTMVNFLSSLGKVKGTIVKNIEEFENLQRNSDRRNNFFCYQINTGGALPDKDYVIIPVEETNGLSESRTQVEILKIRLENNKKYTRKTGIDLNSNDYLKSGTKIGPIELSLILSMGHKSIKLVKRPYIGVLTTGDELISFKNYSNENTNDGKVIDVNGPLLTNLFKSKHYSVLDLGIVVDVAKEILIKIQTGFIVCDIIVITGGASMGSKDHVKDVVVQMGGTVHFGRINIKPGKPAAFASIEYGGNKKFIFCLPGNPVSAYITTLSLVIPFIEHSLKGRSGNMLPLTINDIGDLINVELVDLVAENNNQEYIFDGRLEFVRAKLIPSAEGYKAIVSTRQQSSCLMNLYDCDCLIIIDPSLKNSKFVVGQCYRAIKLKY